MFEVVLVCIVASACLVQLSTTPPYACHANFPVSGIRYHVANLICLCWNDWLTENSVGRSAMIVLYTIKCVCRGDCAVFDDLYNARKRGKVGMDQTCAGRKLVL